MKNTRVRECERERAGTFQTDTLVRAETTAAITHLMRNVSLSLFHIHTHTHTHAHTHTHTHVHAPVCLQG